MKTSMIKKSLFALLTMFCSAGAWAQLPAPGQQEVTDYVEDFSGANSNLSVMPSGWMVQGTGSWSKKTGTPAAIGYQQANTENPPTRFIVTPMVKGTVSFQAIKSSYTASSTNVDVYACTSEGGKFIVGDKLHSFMPTSSGFPTAATTFEVTDYTYLAIRISQAYIGVFTASYAKIEVPEYHYLDVTGVAYDYTTDKNIVVGDDGKGEFAAKITVKNNGNVALEAEEIGKALTLSASSGTFAFDPSTLDGMVTEGLAVGASAELTYTGKVSLKNGKASGTDKLKVTTSIPSGSTASAVGEMFGVAAAVAEVAVLTTSGELNAAAFDFGLVNGSKTATLTIQNNGFAALNVTNITTTVPGLTFDKTSFSVSEGGGTEEVTMTLTGATGKHEGKITVFSNASTPEYTPSKTISGIVIAEGGMMEDFSGAAPGWIIETGSNWAINAGCANNTSDGSSQKYLISPKLTFAENDQLVVSAMPNSQYSTFIKVLTSTDRMNWTVVNLIGSNTGKAPSFSGRQIDWVNKTAYSAYAIPMAAGEYYVAFQSGNSRMNLVAGGALAEVGGNDIYIADYSVECPEAMANHPIAASITYKNVATAATGAYQVKLMDGETVLESKDMESLAAGASATVDFSYLPTAAGTMNISIQVAIGDDYMAQSPVTELVIAKETAGGSVLVGSRTSSASTMPIQTYGSSQIQAEWIWTKSSMKGTIAPGTKISSFSLPYFCTGSDITGRDLKIYMMNTDATSIGSSYTSTTGVTPVLSNSNYTLAKGGTSSAHALLTFELDTPFEYTGGNIRVIFIATGSNAYYTFNWETYTEFDEATYSYKMMALTTDKNRSTSRKSDIPVGYLNYVLPSSTLAGVLTTDGTAPAADKTVVLNSNEGVTYTGTTDAEGNYSVEVIQNDKKFAVSVGDYTYPLYVSVEKDKVLDLNLGDNACQINPDEDLAVAKAGTCNVTLKRTFSAGQYYTICLPFDAAVSAFGTGAKVFAFASAEQVEDICTLKFSPRDAISANTPYILYIGEETACPLFEDVELVAATPEQVESAGVTFNGNYVAGFDMADKYGIASVDGSCKIVKGVNGASLIATGAYLDIYVAQGVKVEVTGFDEATGIEEVDGSENLQPSIVNLQGIKVGKGYKGIVISKEKKFIIK